MVSNIQTNKLFSFILQTIRPVESDNQDIQT